MILNWHINNVHRECDIFRGIHNLLFGWDVYLIYVTGMRTLEMLISFWEIGVLLLQKTNMSILWHSSWLEPRILIERCLGHQIISQRRISPSSPLLIISEDHISPEKLDTREKLDLTLENFRFISLTIDAENVDVISLYCLLLLINLKHFHCLMRGVLSFQFILQIMTNVRNG